MKKVKLIIAIVALFAVSVLVAAYVNSKSENTKEDSSTVVSNNENTSNDKKDDSEKGTLSTIEDSAKETSNTESKDKTSNNGEKENNKEEWLNGKWGNAKRIQTGNVTADDGEGIDNIIKNPIEFKSSTATYNNKTYTNVKYTVENISNNEFSQGYRGKVTFEMLGISGSDVEAINIENYDNVDTEENEITDLYGTTLYKKDDNTIIMCKGGNFFELKRK